MKDERNKCPNCKDPAISQWAFFAYWPFSAQCKNCRVRVRAKNSFWNNLLFQVLGQAAFWGGVLFSITSGLGSIIYGIATGTILALVVVMVSGFFSNLEVL